MKKKVISFIFLLLIFTPDYAQSEGEDLVRLKNGKEIRGVIIEQRPGKFIQVLQIPSNDTVKVDSREIETILKILAVEPENMVIKDTIALIKDSVITNEKDHSKNVVLFNQRPVHIHLRMERIKGGYAGVGWGMAAHRSLYSDLSIGLGFNYYSAHIKEPYQYRKSVAVFTEFRHDMALITSKRLGFVSGLSLGYNFDFSDPYIDAYILEEVTVANGAFLHPHVGLRLNLAKDLGLMTGIGYQYIQTGVKYETANEKIENRNLSSFVFNIALFF